MTLVALPHAAATFPLVISNKKIWHERLSSIEGCLSSKVKIHPWRMCIRRKLIIWKTSQSSLTPWTNSIKQWIEWTQKCFLQKSCRAMIWIWSNLPPLLTPSQVQSPIVASDIVPPLPKIGSHQSQPYFDKSWYGYLHAAIKDVVTKGRVQNKKCPKLWKKSIIFLTPPP